MANLLPYQQLHLKTSHVLQHDLWHGWSAAEDNRRYSEPWLVVDGGGYLKVDGHEYRLQKGDMCLLPDILPKEHGCDRAERRSCFPYVRETGKRSSLLRQRFR